MRRPWNVESQEMWASPEKEVGGLTPSAPFPTTTPHHTSPKGAAYHSEGLPSLSEAKTRLFPPSAIESMEPSN